MRAIILGELTLRANDAQEFGSISLKTGPKAAEECTLRPNRLAGLACASVGAAPSFGGYIGERRGRGVLCTDAGRRSPSHRAARHKKALARLGPLPQLRAAFL